MQRAFQSAGHGDGCVRAFATLQATQEDQRSFGGFNVHSRSVVFHGCTVVNDAPVSSARETRVAYRPTDGAKVDPTATQSFYLTHIFGINSSHVSLHLGYIPSKYTQ